MRLITPLCLACMVSLSGSAAVSVVDGDKTIALASVSADGGLAIGLNGSPVEDIAGLTNDSALPRSGIRGIFRERLVTFDASRLREGENVITLDLLPLKMHTGKRQNYPHFSIMYDFLQLEVDAEQRTEL